MTLSMRRPPSPPGWSSVRPWTPRLALLVREITPVSATFVLSSLDHVLDDDDSDHAGPSQIHKHSGPLSISDLLGKGLAVKVNNTPWQRVVMHIDDDADDEAIVILYGLLPARQYDIELAVVAGEDSIRGKIITELGSDSDDANASIEADEDAPILPTVQPLTPAATRPASPSPPDPPRPLTVEERASHLLHELTTLDAERESLIARLKASRRESQRADAALRSEVDALKRASEKAAQADQRSRQKILALQEATKRLLAASVEADEQVKLVEGSLPQLEERSRVVELEYTRVQAEALQSRADVEEAAKGDRRRAGELESELATLNHRLEKLTHKKEKLVTDTVPELELQLAELGKKIEEVERSGNPPPASAMPVPPEFDHEAHYPHHYAQNSVPYPTQHSINSARPLQPIGRPSLPHISTRPSPPNERVGHGRPSPISAAPVAPY